MYLLICYYTYFHLCMFILYIIIINFVNCIFFPSFTLFYHSIYPLINHCLLFGIFYVIIILIPAVRQMLNRRFPSMFIYPSTDLSADPTQAQVTANDVTGWMQLAYQFRRSADPDQLKAVVVNLSYHLASHLYPTTVQECFVYFIYKHYLDILLDISGKTNTTCTMELPVDQEFMAQLRTLGWYIEPISAPESEEKSTNPQKMLVSNIVHVPHGGYEHQSHIPSANRARNLISAAIGVAKTASFSICQRKADRKKQRFKDMDLDPNTALEQLWAAITEHVVKILFNGIRSVGFTTTISYDAYLEEMLKQGGWVVDPNLDTNTMAVTLPAS